jgi:transposase
MRVNMLSAISNRGKLRFILYRGSMNSDKLIEFMRRLVKDALKGAFDNVDKGTGRKKRKALKRKVFLILDNLSAHRSKKVTAWLLKHKEKIEVFYLPPYAPEYNPDELLNADLKRSVGNRSMVRSKKELEHNVRSHMKILQLAPEKIQSFFNAPLTKYAA